jgi:uncharacterized membrane protein YphA (DoxX/SURF4 family)
MQIALWIDAILVALLYVLAGGMKVFNTAKFSESAPWAQKIGPMAVRAVGALELIGAIGLILPQATGIGAPVLTILAAAGLLVIQIVAIGIHIVEKSLKSLPMNAVLVILPLFVILGRLLWAR